MQWQCLTFGQSPSLSARLWTRWIFQQQQQTGRNNANYVLEVQSEMPEEEGRGQRRVEGRGACSDVGPPSGCRGSRRIIDSSATKDTSGCMGAPGVFLHGEASTEGPMTATEGTRSSRPGTLYNQLTGESPSGSRLGGSVCRRGGDVRRLAAEIGRRLETVHPNPGPRKNGGGENEERECSRREGRKNKEAA